MVMCEKDPSPFDTFDILTFVYVGGRPKKVLAPPPPPPPPHTFVCCQGAGQFTQITYQLIAHLFVQKIDPDYLGTDVWPGAAPRTLWVSFSDAVTLDRTKIRRPNLRGLYRSNDSSTLTNDMLGLTLDPLWTVRHPTGPSMGDEIEKKVLDDLLAWQTGTKKQKSPYAVPKATGAKEATSKAAKGNPVKKATKAKSKPAKGNPTKAKSKPAKGNPTKAKSKPTNMFHTFHLRFTH